jgi:hypothetical protein
VPHYRCEACRVRLYVQGDPLELVGDLCPECGSLLQPAGELSELVGFRSIKSLNGKADSAESSAHQGVADLIEAVAVRRAAMLDHDSLEPEEWLDVDSGHAEAVAASRPVTYL